MKRVISFIFLIFVIANLSACIAAAATAGAAGGYYVGKEYDIVKKDSKNEKETTEEKDSNK
jgi:hypothetical protein